jgi:fibronectin type 3 domain-containing protein
LATMALDYMAACYAGLEKWQEASETLQSLVNQELPPPKQVDTYLKLGSIYEEKLNEKEKAIEVYSALLQKYPQLPIAQSLNERTAKLHQDVSQYQQGNQPPRSSEIISTAMMSPSAAKLIWQPNQERDFDHYKLIRSSSPGVELTDVTVALINKQLQTEYVDENLTHGSTYFYRLYTFDKGGLHAASREVAVKLEEKQIQATIHLVAQSNAWYQVSLSWNPYPDRDFDSYKIHRSTTPGVTLASRLVRSVFDQSTTKLEDIDLKENTTYYYKAYVYNSNGSNKASNEVKVTTLANLPPQAVNLNRPVTLNNTTIELSWSPSQDRDFSMYRIYRSENSPVTLSSPPIWMNSNSAINKYKDTGLTNGKTYYYKVVVYDKGGLLAESNEVEVTL